MENSENKADKLNRLLSKDVWTNEDKRWLSNYLDSSNDNELRRLMEEKFNEDLSEDVLHIDSARLLKAIHEKIGPEETSYKMGFFNRRRKLIAAASFIGLIITGTFFFISRQKKASPNIAVRKNVITPGKTGAVLKLSDGRTIVLDSANDGMLAMQGNVQVEKKNGTISYTGKDDKILYNDIITDQGRQWSMTLPDGSKVWLNASSSIHYPVTFKGNERLVEITGEAYFEVIHNAQQPFRVKVGNQIIEDLGTHFNINAYPNESAVRTTLIEGALKVSKMKSAVVLTPGQQAVSTINTLGFTIANPNVDDVIAWKNGFFAFRAADITIVMRQIARWYNVDIQYQGTVSGLEFSGKIDRDLSLDEVLKILAETKVHFKVEEDKKRIIILP
ncbi:FecR family protein [Chitinophagaceae bacterium LWZ2-11]